MKPTHIDPMPLIEKNLPSQVSVILDVIFGKYDDFHQDHGGEYLFDWTHSGLAYGIAERLGVTDLEELHYCLGEEIKKRESLC